MDEAGRCEATAAASVQFGSTQPRKLSASQMRLALPSSIGFVREVTDMMSRRGLYRRETGTSQGGEASIGQGVDGTTMEFIQKYLTSYTKWEVLKYYGENPAAVETPRAFAKRLGKDVRQVAEALKSLAKSGILSNGRDQENATYALSAEDGERATLQKIAESSRTNNRFRLLLNYHITRASLAKYKAERPCY